MMVVLLAVAILAVVAGMFWLMYLDVETHGREDEAE